ncbi:teneurin-a isoform X2 [Lucilia cuprina]|uniref:teneurin-a isoform X2 n=1 Tax=Lucilia cuprina TaxID=7375 RepID=UPI001F066A62|nr:teneurin-a isoform X2 [Lucilia cuprina]
MSSHSGTIGRKRGGSGSGGSEYYFSGGEHAIRRQRSAEWHSRHAYNSSSEDEYQNTGQASAFDTQLLAQLLLQSQQLANLDRYNSDFENEEHLSSRLNEYPSSSNRDASLNANAASQSYLQHLQQQESTELCSPLKQTPTANLHTPTTVTTTTTANNKFLNNANLGFLPSTTRSTNPFLNSKYDSQSNSDSLSDRISFSGSSAILDRLQTANDFAAVTNPTTVQSVMNNAFLMPASSTANSLNPNSTRSHRSKSGRSGGNRGASGMTSSSSATSSNSNATLNNTRNERDKFKLQQLQMELREYSESNIESSNASILNGVGVTGVGGELDELHISDGENTEPPPEPAPPEIPPRTQSLLMSLRKHSEYKLKYEEKGDQKHEEFIPTSQLQQLQQQPQVLQQQKDYLIADATVRCSESQSKSIASNSDTQSQQGLGPMPQHQQQMPQSMSTGNNTIGGHGGHDRGGGGGGIPGGSIPGTMNGPNGPHCQMSGSQPLVMPQFPLRNSHSAHAPHYSPYSPSRFHIDKRCQHRCSWKCLSIALILISVVLTAMLAYFAAVSSMKPNMDTTNCILVQDVKSQPHDLHGNTKTNLLNGNSLQPTAYPTEESIQTSTSDHSSSTNGGGGGFQNLAPSLQLQHQQQLLLQQQQPHTINQQLNLGINTNIGGSGGIGMGMGAGLMGQDATSHLQDQSYTAQQQQQLNHHHQPLLKWPQVVELKDFNELYHANIPAYQFWTLEFRNKHPAFVRFNFTLPWGANFAVYSRRNVAPSVTQYDFVEFIKGGRLDSHLRHRRSVIANDTQYRRKNMEDTGDILLDMSAEQLQRLSANDMAYMATRHYFNDMDNDNNNNDDMDDIEAAEGDDDEEDVDNEDNDSVDSSFEYTGDIETPLDTAKHIRYRQQQQQQRRRKRSAAGMDGGLPALDMDTMMVNVSLLQYLDTGLWFISVYNDELVSHSATLIVEEAEGVSTTCPNDCSGRGSCYLGKCDCIDGYQGSDCSKSVCPVLCSAHGHYGGGVCHCEEGWKGSECDIPVGECEVPNCSSHGRCIEGECHCERGWKGPFCDQHDCLDPLCSSHGTCVAGQCYCKAGWQGEDCGTIDQQVYQCLPGCSEHGTYDLETGQCVCERHWTGPDCSQAVCSLDCGPNGVCESGKCRCNPGWTGNLCDQLPCDARCSEHGQCKNGTCVCSQGWNGRHCTLPGCENGCSRHGQCTLENGEYRCDCIEGWAGTDCSIALEMNCKDNIDNDGDGMTDCSDSECCSHPACSEHIMCLSSNDPVEVLLRKQPPSVTASFYQRVKFLIEENSVQSYAHMDEYSENRVSVMRGQVITPQGLGIVGIRVSVDRDSRFGFTLTRQGGWFDVLVNGGGAVTLQFQRSPFRPLTRTVFVPWNRIVVLPPVQMQLSDDDESASRNIKVAPLNPALTFLNSILYHFNDEPISDAHKICMEHDHEELKPQLISTWMPNGIGAMSGKRVIFAETQIVQESIQIPGSDLHLTYQSSQASGYLSIVRMRLTSEKIPKTLTHVHVGVEIEGSLHVKTYEADPNLIHTFAWNKRNVYRQKVYGVTIARISVGYQHSTCDTPVWITQTAKLQGYDVDISDIGGWGLDIHHHYNFHEGILQKGDGSTLHMKEYPRTVKVVMGTGLQRPLNCPDHCNGIAKDAKLLTPIALASGPDGSLYVGDFNLVRRITPDGKVYTILQLSATQVSYQYYLAVSPADGHLYISDPERHQILRLLRLEKVKDPSINSEPVVGSGQRCIPGDEGNCGDGGPALQARLSHPKGLAIAADRTMYIADGTNIRAVDPKGIIHTLIGHHGHHNHWSPAPCSGTLMANQAQLQWPTGLALSPLDGSLHFIDDRLVLRLTSDMKIRVVAGTPLHCSNSGQDKANKTTDNVLGTVLAMAFSPFGDLYIADSDSRRVNSIRVVDTSGNMRYFAGKQENAGALTCDCTNGAGLNASTSGLNSNIGSSHGSIGGGSVGAYSTTTNPTRNNGGTTPTTPSGSNGFNGNGNGGFNGNSASSSSSSASNSANMAGGCICSPSSPSGLAGIVSGNLMSTGPTTTTTVLLGAKTTTAGGLGSTLGSAGTMNDDGTLSNAETLLSSNARFQAISAIAVAQDGVINVADQGSLHVLALEHYLPSHDENGEFHIPYPPTSEVYVFNRYGQHVATKDLASGKTRYSFLYSKNTSFGRLSTVTDASGNKIQFLRDYSNVVSSIENTQDHKSDIQINGIGIMTKLTEKGRQEIELDYDSNTGLLNSRSSGGETYIYQYDEFGRVTGMILPSGEIVRITSQLADNKGLTVYVHASVESLFSREKGDTNELLVLGGVRSTFMKKGQENANAEIKPNNTLVIHSSNGVIVESSAVARHPLLEAALPVEAEMLAMWSHQSVTMGEGLTNNMYSVYNLVGDVRNPQQTLNREIWVNQSRVIGVEFDQFTNRETFYDMNRTPILIVAYDQSGLPKSYYPTNGYPVNMTYDRFNRIEGWAWGPAELKYSYDRHGLLSEITSQQDGIISFVYNDWNLVSEIGLASQRKFVLQYDESGGLRHVTLPSGTKHSFSMQTSIGFIRNTYTPPGSTKPYLQHYSHSGALLQTIFPGDGARIVYRYNAAGQLTEIVHGDGKSEFIYNEATAMPSTVSHTERELEYRWDFEYTGGLLSEERIDFIAKTGLSNAKFTYEYDTDFRVISIQGRIGGQNLPAQNFAYDMRTGQPSMIGQFKLMHPLLNQTQVYDGTASFTRTVDGRFMTQKVTLAIHRLEVFRMEYSFGVHGRITQTRTYTRNMAVNTYTNVKNYTWDCDGQLIGVEAQEPWGFRYDDNGNLLSLTYRGNTIPMEYNNQDRIVKFGEGQYKYDTRGLVAQNAREERFYYNTQGLLVRATKRGRFDVRYYYDHLKRLATRKDNFGNVTQFFYNNQQRPYEVSQIYSPRDGKLMSLTYDDVGHLIYAQVYRHKYYVATDQSGTPIMIFNQYGEGIREIMRSPFGHIVYDSNPYLYLPIDFCGGILDQVTTLVHMADGRVYDPLIGQWMTPNWENVKERITTPTKMHLYRFNGNDPINVGHDRNYPATFKDWMKTIGFNVENLVPQLSRNLWEQPSLWGRAPYNPIALDLKKPMYNVPTMAVESGFLAHLNIRRMSNFEDLNSPPKSALKYDVMTPGPRNIGSDTEPPFGKGIVVSRTADGQAIVSSVPAANAIYRDVYTSVFNRSKLLPFTFVVHNAQQDSFFFVKEELWRASEDRQQLKRLQGQVNTTFHEITRENGSGTNYLDVKIHGLHAIINLRYGTTVEKEKQRLMHHAKLTAVRKAWHREKEALKTGLNTEIEWSQQEIDEILKQNYANNYEGEYIHDVTLYPELAEDPYNIKFVKRKGATGGAAGVPNARKRRRRSILKDDEDITIIKTEIKQLKQTSTHDNDDNVENVKQQSQSTSEADKEKQQKNTSKGVVATSNTYECSQHHKC